MGRGYLREILGAYCGLAPSRVPIEYGPHGKPSLAGVRDLQPLSFNLSYANRRVVVAITKGAKVGIDIETVRRHPVLDRMAASVFSPAELHMLSSMPEWKRKTTLVRGWTRKEAVLKAVGCGLVEDLTRIDVLTNSDEPVSLVNFRETWFLVDVPIPGFDHIASLSVSAGGICVRTAPWRDSIPNYSTALEESS